jgi:hypothetical protein
VWAWAALHGILGFVIVGIGRYDLFERIMKSIAAIKFGAIILLAILLTPSLTELAIGLVPGYRRVLSSTRWRSSGGSGGRTRSPLTPTGCASADGVRSPGSRRCAPTRPWDTS